MPISTVLFDADGVLQFPGPIFEHFDQRYGWSEPKLREFFDHLFHERPDFDDGLTSDTDLMAAIGAALTDWGWVATPEVFVRDWLQVGTVPDPEALALVAKLRACGIVCGLATNQNSMRGRYMHEVLGYRELFDHHFYSYAMGCAKPDPAFFASALAALDVPPDTVLFIDDHEPNVEAARHCGLVAEHHTLAVRLRDRLAGYGLAV